MPLPFPVVTPESLGIHSGNITKLVEAFSQLDQAHSFILMRHGKIAAAGNWSPYSLEISHELFSLSKSFVSCAIGLAQAEGLLSINDSLVSFFPEAANYNISPAMQRVTLKHLLTMTFGHDRCSFSFVDFKQPGWVKKILESPLVYEPGTHFEYNSGATFMLAAVIKSCTGQNVVDYLQPRLFEPLGIRHPQWDCNADGCNIGGWGLWLSTCDLAKFSQLLLQHGEWEGRQLLPKEYLAEATTYQSDNSANAAPDWKVGYGYQFWRCQHNCYRGDGASGQYVLILPEHDAALAFNSGLNDMQRVLTCIWDILLPGFANSPLPENPAQYAVMQQCLHKLAANTIDCHAPRHSLNAKYQIASNPWGFQHAEITCTGDVCRFSLDGVEVTAGFNDYITTDIPLASSIPRPVAARACWEAPDKLTILALCLATTARFTYKLAFEDNDLLIKRTTPIYFHEGLLTDIVCRATRC